MPPTTIGASNVLINPTSLAPTARMATYQTGKAPQARNIIAHVAGIKEYRVAC